MKWRIRKAYKEGIDECDYSLIRLYRRFVELQCLDADVHHAAQSAILKLDMDQLRHLLATNFDSFKKAVNNSTETEQGKKLLNFIEKHLFRQIQISFFDEGDFNA